MRRPQVCVPRYCRRCAAAQRAHQIGGGTVAGARSMADLADGVWDPKAAAEHMQRLGLR